MRALGPDLTLLCAFYFGMTAYHYGDRIRLGAAGSIAAFAAMCAARPILGYASHWAALVEAILAAVVVAQLAFGQLGRFGDLFDWNITRFYGQISYSFYLLHPLTLLVAWRIPSGLGAVVDAGISPPLVAAGLAVVTIAAITPIAWLSYRYVERPAVAIGKFLASGQRQRTQKMLKRGI
jgi:peptidoglycan/LPS O-acetylase OafA/YrhL